MHRLNVAVSSDGEVVEWADRCIEEFLRLPEKALLICNEGTLIREKSKRYVGAIAGLVSSGDSRQKYCWEAGQSAHLLDLCINGAARSRLRLLIVGLKGEEQQISAVLRAQCVDDTARNMSDIKGQLMRSPVGRAWCDGVRWFPKEQLKQRWQTNGTAWEEQLRTAMVQHRNIGHDWQFSPEQNDLLSQYYNANKLLVDCLNSDCYVSREVRQEIETGLLLPRRS